MSSALAIQVIPAANTSKSSTPQAAQVTRAPRLSAHARRLRKCQDTTIDIPRHPSPTRSSSATANTRVAPLLTVTEESTEISLALLPMVMLLTDHTRDTSRNTQLRSAHTPEKDTDTPQRSTEAAEDPTSMVLHRSTEDPPGMLPSTTERADAHTDAQATQLDTQLVSTRTDHTEETDHTEDIETRATDAHMLRRTITTRDLLLVHTSGDCLS